MKLSVVIPARDEETSIASTLAGVARSLDRAGIDHEVLVIDDASSDGTQAAVAAAAEEDPRIRFLRSPNPPGFGMAVRAGLDEFSGDAVAIFMADSSDDPDDLCRYHAILEEGWDCAFGSRFAPGGSVKDYPLVKLAINRLANLFIRLIFLHGYNDTTNAFKAYRREVIETVSPLLSHHFNLTVELPLKAIVRGSSFRVIPISWTNRTAGTSKLAMREMGSRYMFIVLYVWLEHHLSRGDYRRSIDA